MAREEVIIEVDEEGRLTYEVRGVKGAGCKALTAELDKVLGGGGTSKPTSELYEKPQQHKEKKRV